MAAAGPNDFPMPCPVDEEATEEEAGQILVLSGLMNCFAWHDKDGSWPRGNVLKPTDEYAFTRGGHFHYRGLEELRLIIQSPGSQLGVIEVKSEKHCKPILASLLREAFGEAWAWCDTEDAVPHFSHVEHGKVYLFSWDVVPWTERAQRGYHRYVLDLSRIWEKIGFGERNTICLVSDFGNVSLDTNVLLFPKWPWSGVKDPTYDRFASCLRTLVRDPPPDVRRRLADLCFKMELTTTAWLVTYAEHVDFKMASRGSVYELQLTCQLPKSQKIKATTHIEPEPEDGGTDARADTQAVPEGCISLALSAGKVFERPFLGDLQTSHEAEHNERRARGWANQSFASTYMGPVYDHPACPLCGRL